MRGVSMLWLLCTGSGGSMLLKWNDNHPIKMYVASKTLTITSTKICQLSAMKWFVSLILKTICASTALAKVTPTHLLPQLKCLHESSHYICNLLLNSSETPSAEARHFCLNIAFWAFCYKPYLRWKKFEKNNFRLFPLIWSVHLTALHKTLCRCSLFEVDQVFIFPQFNRRREKNI